MRRRKALTNDEKAVIIKEYAIAEKTGSHVDTEKILEGPITKEETVRYWDFQNCDW